MTGEKARKDEEELLCPYSYEQLERMLSAVLSPHRFRHTVSVSYTAAALAMTYGADLPRARLAGCLHDCAKYLSDGDILRCCEEEGIRLSETEKKAPWIVHAVYGPVLAKKLYGVTDPEVLSAIRWHTTGREDMTLLEKIIFTADYIEPEREPFPGLAEVRGAAFRDLDRAVLLILENTISFLRDGDRPIDPHALKALEYYRVI